MATNLIEINGAIDSYGWQRSNVKYQLQNLKNKEVTVRISSMGGDVNEAMKISQLLADHGNVTVQFLGMVASAATWMAYGASKVQMAEDALWLCHKTSVLLDIYKSLNADELDAKIEELNKAKKTNEALDLIIAKKYADHSGANISDMLDLMKDAAWLTAKDVKEKGLVDEIIKASGSIKNCEQMIIQNCADLDLPVPHFAEPQQEQKDSLIDTIVNKCKELFVSKDGVPASDFHKLQFSAEQNTNNNTTTLMNKNFVAVNALLNVEGVEESEGKITLTNDQMTAICNALEAKKKADDQLQKVSDILDKIEDNKSISGIENKAQSLVNLINRIPVGAVVTTLNSGEHKDEELKGSDSINDIYE